LLASRFLLYFIIFQSAALLSPWMHLQTTRTCHPFSWTLSHQYVGLYRRGTE